MDRLIRLVLILVSFYCHTGSCNLAENGDKTIHLSGEPATFNGIAGDETRYRFSLADGEYMHVSASQTEADIRFKLFDQPPGAAKRAVFESGIPSLNWIDDEIIITQGHCSVCIIQVSPETRGDAAGNYQLILSKKRASQSAELLSILQLMNQGNIFWAKVLHYRSAMSTALDYYQQALPLAVDAKQPRLQVRLVYLISQLLHHKGQYNEQRKMLLALMENHADDLGDLAIPVLFELTNIALADNKLRQAKSYADHIHALAASSEYRVHKAASLEVYGSVAQANGHFNQAIEYYLKAKDMYWQAGNWTKSVELSISHGWFEYRAGNLDKALEVYKEALALALNTDLLRLQVDLYEKIGSVHRRLGNARLAHVYIDKALEHSASFSHLFLDGWAKQAKARTYLDTGMYHLASDVFEEARVAFEKINAQSDINNINYFLADTYKALKNYQQAEQALKQVLSFDLQGDNRFYIGSDYGQLAELAMLRREYTNALAYQQKAFEFLGDTDDFYLLGRQYSQAGVIYLHNGQKETSQDFFEKAHQVQRENQDYFGLIQTGYRHAKALLTWQQTEQAYSKLSTVLDMVREQRGKIAASTTKKQFLALQQDMVSLHADLLISNQGALVESLSVVESFRSLGLRESMQSDSSPALLSPEVAEKLVELESSLRQKVVDYHALADKGNRQNIVRAARKLMADIDKIEAQLMAAPAKGGEQPILTQASANVAQIQQILAEDTLALYFDVSDSKTHLWALDKGQVEYFELPAREVLSAQVKRLTALLGPRKGASSRRLAQHEAISELSDSLFSKVDIDWQGYKHLLVIADDMLNLVPFSILYSPGSHTSIIENHMVSYIPSLTLLQRLAGQKQGISDTGQMLVVADPQMRTAAAQHKVVAEFRSGIDALELPYTAKEAQAIHKIAKQQVELLHRRDASKAKLLAMPLDSYQVIHFATHGMANDYLPNLGGLVFSNFDSDDNLLLATEIRKLNLDAQLVVLSGCETGTGKLIEGEGLQGINTAFFEAGAKGVISSLWSVRDDTTALLMEAFYLQLVTHKKSPEEALRLAQLHIMNLTRKNGKKPWRDPYYWAGFVLQGAGGAYHAG